MPCNDRTFFGGHVSLSPLLAEKLFFLLLASVMLAVLTSACGLYSSGPARSGKSYVINGKRYYILATAEGYREKGLASWYGDPFHGRKTASGEVFDKNEISAAHKTLPLKTWVEVKNLSNNKKMVIRINDRGPFISGRIIDLSQAAAMELGVYRPGTAPVVVTAVPASQAKRLTELHPRGRTSKSTAARRSP